MIYNEVHLKDTFSNLCTGDQDPTVQLILPDNLESMGWGDMRRPSIIVCPGGGYRMCSDREDEVIALRFVAKGYNAFVLRYSCTPNRFPTQIREVAATVELIHKNAEKWHCDTEKIAIIGFSAGGHLAAHYSNAYNSAEVREIFPESKPVNACILCYPVITGKPAYRSEFSIRNLFGCETITPEVEQGFSLEDMVTEHTPPTFLWHTQEDVRAFVQNSLIYANALIEHNVPVALHIYPHGPHGLSTGDTHTNADWNEKKALTEDWMETAFRWLNVTL